MLFLNRRGYAPLLICRDCGHRIQCPHCTSWLSEHRITGEVICHHCGFKMFTPKRCPNCASEDGLTACGPGVERIAEEVKNRFPTARVEILSSDITTNYKEISEVIRKTSNKEVDILIGTQILAKGHNLALWAYELKFLHPTTKEKLTFKVYPPEEMVPWKVFNLDILK